MKNFDAKKYAGHWYEIVRDDGNVYTPLWTDCVTKEFQLNRYGDVDLYFRGRYPIVGYKGVDGTMYECDSGLCQATMGGRPERHPLKIFYTDYENFEISYNCSKWWGSAKEMLSINSRHETLSPEMMKKARAIINEKLPWYTEYLKTS